MKIYRWLPLISLISVLSYLSSIPKLRIIQKDIFPGWMTKELASYSIAIGTNGFFSYTITLHPEFVVRKLGHFAAFGLLGAFAYFALGSKRASIVFAIALAILDEVHQGFIPGRGARFWDIVLDSTGAISGILAMQRWYFKQKNESNL